MTNQLTNTRIGFIGAGNMAGAIARGLVKKGHPASNIIMSNLTQDKLDEVSEELGVLTTLDNQELCDQADIVLLAVKPQVMKNALADVDFSSVDCVISVAAGLPISKLTEFTHQQTAVVRSMPNTPSLELCGATGLFADSNVKDKFGAITEYIFGAIGEFEWIASEDLMDTVTALSGSSPAYFFRFMEGLISAGIEQGMPEDVARNLVVQSALGAATLIKNHPDVAISTRREQVTSPKGTTAAALDSLENSGIAKMTKDAVDAAVNRGKELAND
ncbi:MAG: pyrroline-5-carboxylate reductase [Gammaproteobacteria bacterium]|nr:pyrroline-5-carboxylate reductase [Gammaproteobacteria bacterium]